MKRKIAISAAIFVVMLLMVFVIKDRQKVVDLVQKERLERNALSLSVIQSPDKNDPNALYRSLITLADVIDQKYLKDVHSLSTHPDSRVRAGVGYLLSFQHDTESERIIGLLQKEADPLVRSHLIHASRKSPHPARLTWLKLILNGEKLTAPEKAEVESSIYLSLNSADESKAFKEKLIQQGFKALKDSAVDPLLELNQLFPKDDRVLAIDRKIISGDFPVEWKRFALRTLFEARDALTIKEYSKWIHHPNFILRSIAIENLPVICPKDRWTWIHEGFQLEKGFAEKSTWLLSAERLQGKKSLEFIETAFNAISNAGSDQEKESIEIIFERSKKRPDREICN